MIFSAKWLLYFLSSCHFKAEAIISGHVDHRKTERDQNPQRFNVKKTLAEKCVQRPVPDMRENSDGSYYVNQFIEQTDKTPGNLVFIIWQIEKD